MVRIKIKKSKVVFTSQGAIKLLIASTLLLTGLFFLLNLIAQSGFTVLEFSYSRNDLRSFSTENIVKGQIRRLSIKPKSDNLGIIAVRFDTFNKINHDILKFRIKEVGKKDWYSETIYTTEQFQPEDYFTIGFPVIADSSQRTYIMELESVKGTPNESVALSKKSPLLVTKHKFNKHNILSNKSIAIRFIITKLINFFSNYKNILLTLILLSPFTLFFIKYIFLNNKLNFPELRKRINKLSKSADNFFLLDKNKAFPELDGIRAWAITMVYFAHTMPWLLSMSNDVNGSSKVLLDAIVYFFRFLPFIGIDGGGIGVDLFFVLSGFLIYMTILKKNFTFRDFMTRRFKRLLPVHFFLILGNLSKLAVPVMFLNIFFLADLFPKTANVNLLTWTLTYEIIFYLLCAFWFIIGRNIKILQTWKFFFLFGLLIYFSGVILTYPLASINIRYPDTTRFIAFFFGLALAKLYFGDSKIWIKAQVIFTHSALLGLFIISIFKYFWGSLILEKRYGQIGNNVGFILLDIGIFLLIGSLLIEKQNFIKKLFSLKLLRIIGIISYSIYLFHYNWGLYIGNIFVKDIFYTPIRMIAFVFTGYAVSVIISILLFHYLEKPYFVRSK